MSAVWLSSAVEIRSVIRSEGVRFAERRLFRGWVSRGIMSEGIDLAKMGRIEEYHTPVIMSGYYVQGDFYIDLAVFSSLLDAISNGATTISLNPLQNKIHEGGYHPLRHPCQRKYLRYLRVKLSQFSA